MVSKFTLLGLLLATVALAVPSSLVEAPIARGHEDRQSQPITHVASHARSDAASINHMYNNVWAGAFMSRTIVRIIPMPRLCSVSFFARGDIYIWSMVLSLSRTFGWIRTKTQPRVKSFIPLSSTAPRA